MFDKLFILFIIVFIFISFPQPSTAAVNLIKSPNSSAVYYVDAKNVRHTFPNFKTYQSWYGDDFSEIVTMSENYVASLPLGRNITLKAGRFLVKVPSSPEVYAVEPGGTLRHILSAEVAEKIYGINWQEKLIDLPEVFFENYVIGQPISAEHQIPDGVVYNLIGTQDYYYKKSGHVKKFASFKDVLANGYASNDVIPGITTFLLHGQEIKGAQDFIVKPNFENNLAKYDCENKNLRAAVIFIYDDLYVKRDLEKINNITAELPTYFNWTTHNLSKLKIDTDVFKINLQTYHLDKNKELDVGQVAYDFYDSHTDEYDFLFIFDNFSTKNKILGEHYKVTNQIQGIHKTLFRAEVQFGSLGKLKGVIHMNNIKKHPFDSEVAKNFTLGNLTHEMLHQWSGSMTFKNSSGVEDASLLAKDTAHWQNNINFISPLGGYGWSENKDGTFSYNADELIRPKYSNLDLYAMGLMPLRGVGDLFYLIQNQGESGNTISAIKIVIEPESLEEVMGEWECKN